METDSLIGFFYSLTLTLHNLSRWLVVVFGVWAILRAVTGWRSNREWTRLDDRAGMAFVSIIDVQLLLGLLLYFLFSPYSRIAFQNISAAMSDRMVRFFAVEHLVIMVVALALAHIGRAVSKKASTAKARHGRAALWFTITLLLILASIPWPFLNLGRPWFRLFGIAF